MLNTEKKVVEVVCYYDQVEILFEDGSKDTEFYNSSIECLDRAIELDKKWGLR